MKFPTHVVLSVSTGKLLGDARDMYPLFKWLIGRPTYTHELAYYGRMAAAALCHAMPSLPTLEDGEGITEKNWREYLRRWQTFFGAEIDLPDALRECLADEKNPIETLEEMAPGKVIVVDMSRSIRDDEDRASFEPED